MDVSRTFAFNYVLYLFLFKKAPLIKEYSFLQAVNYGIAKMEISAPAKST